MTNRMTPLLTRLLAVFGFLFLVSSCMKGHLDPDPTAFTPTAFAAGLKSPIGLTADDQGRLWVTEAGTGNKDAQVSLITTDGQVYPAITGFNSYTSAESAGTEGISHLTYKDNKVYILHGIDRKLYIADVTGFGPSSPPISASTLPSEDLGTFVDSQNLVTPLNSNVYNLTFGPDGDLFIVDAGANAIIRRDKDDKSLSVFARIPNTATGDAVPTGIVFDGTKFLVSTLTGFPFISGAAKIYQVNQSGVVSDYKGGFTTLTDICLTPNNNPIVTSLAQFAPPPGPPVGFQPNTGSVRNGEGTVLLDKQMFPTAIERVGPQNYYVLSYALGTVQKVTY